MDALKLLEAQHREIEQLFASFYLAAEDDAEQRQDVFVALADQIAAHAKIEEEIFYPRVAAEPTEDLLQESFEEHQAIKRALLELMRRPVTALGFDARLRQLQRDIDDHVQEEEAELFPKVRQILSPAAREELGGELDTLLTEVMSRGDPRREIPKELALGAP